MSEQKNSIVPSTSDQNRNSGYLLVVDSDIDNLFYTSILLQRFEYHLHIAKTAREAFIAATTAKPSLIITALDLNDLSGLSLMQLLKKNVGTLDIPFIVLRRPEDSTAECKCLHAEAVACLSKPVSAEELYRAVQTAIKCQGDRKRFHTGNFLPLILARK